MWAAETMYISSGITRIDITIKIGHKNLVFDNFKTSKFFGKNWWVYEFQEKKGGGLLGIF